MTMRRLLPILLAVAVVIALAVLLVIALSPRPSQPAASAAPSNPSPTAASAAPSSSSPPSSPAGDTALDALSSLPVAAPDMTGYVRTAFRIWTDADHNGCDTRAEVLIAEAVSAPVIGKRCALSGGSWLSAYDGILFGPGDVCGSVRTTANCLDIDHTVPLAEAWSSGASSWTDARREAYANDLSDPRTLAAVSAASNRSKGDRDPALWWPPLAGAERCIYAAAWVEVKLRWSLSIDTAERDALRSALSACPPVPLLLSSAP
jgi:hypothetical protein